MYVTRHNRIMPIPATNGPHIGASTHIQDHVITLHNLSVMKISERIPRNGNPVDAVF
nr:MAG TPA: hypothetical protein [Caudoviricetes sp.]